MTEPSKNPGELPTYHGTCPYCASAVSCVTRDGMTYARCSHRGCGARGPYHHDLVRAVEWFTGKPHPKAPTQDAPSVERCRGCSGFGITGDFDDVTCSICNGTGRTEAAKGE